VFGLALLGYAYLVVMALGLLTLTVLTVLAVWSTFYLPVPGLILVILVGGLTLSVLRALWVKIEPPAGERVTRQEAPELFAMFDEVRAKLRTPVVHQVIITREYSATILQLRRFGAIAGYHNVLVVGLLFLKGLSSDQFKAVLAHELAHLSRGHARSSHWIYRLRRIWEQFDRAFEKKPQFGGGTIRAFFNSCRLAAAPLSRQSASEG
jgi:Zn-dependent protease with chaperone function